MRRQASLLLEHGHPNARLYPINILWEEAQMVVERLNWSEAMRAIAFQSAASSLLSKKGQKNFKDLLKKLQNGE